MSTIETGMNNTVAPTLRKLIAVLSAIIFIPTIISADDWDVHQNNFQITKDRYHVRLRDYYCKDLTHLQLGWALLRDLIYNTNIGVVMVRSSIDLVSIFDSVASIGTTTNSVSVSDPNFVS